MHPATGMILCLAYVLGLLATAIPWGGYGCLGLGLAAAVLLPRLWRTGPKRWLWLIAGTLGLIASLYLHLRVPHPGATDISRLIQQPGDSHRPPVVTVQGVVESLPRLTRSQKAQFWLRTSQFGPVDTGQPTTGRVYTTVPLLQATGINPGQRVTVTGTMYQPKSNPGQCVFDFKDYLGQEGSFAGLVGQKLEPTERGQNDRHWGWWSIRQRIVQSQVRWLNVPAGPLVSAMVLGGRAVDLPFEIRDCFVRVGLAHALAASGFQVSLILGVVLALTQQFTPRVQFGLGAAANLLFVGLAGPSPSVLRAAVMGFAVLLGVLSDRKIKPLASLVVAATLLLLLNPLWIWDLGFQLSFAATLGLLVTVPPLMQGLDWMPPGIASLMAVPIAATIWTLPIQIYAFCLISPYCILANIISVPLISMISLGGFVSSMASLIWPVAGSGLAWFLYYPAHLLIELVNFFCQLPGNSVSIGTISIAQLLGLYGLISLVWLHSWWQRRWWLAAALSVGLVVAPVLSTQATLARVTVLSTPTPVVVIQNRGKVTLINAGNQNSAVFTVMPFLQQQGINQIDWAIATDLAARPNSGWLDIVKHLPIRNFFADQTPFPKAIQAQQLQQRVQARQGTYQTLAIEQDIQAGDVRLHISSSPQRWLQFKFQEQSWILLPRKTSSKQQLQPLQNATAFPQSAVLVWSGQMLHPEFLAQFHPVAAIATGSVEAKTSAQLAALQIPLYKTTVSGAIQWTRLSDLEPSTEALDQENVLP
ncbi:hypothetical protein DO97_15370 [Neosynechococcus sphagnicola sy1]|uniref:Competence protein n=1 Tax=Neosynechococcus sphagnicola sy1 TaxID=1497020 RepID=A0A098TIK2_9CYAN|nr:ComEC/Rec2 family competence protein [Neosynechococcus sphagnicola]KGF71812.1 hypothetical protein DO97_15370 [Neosynechococcus sphagnicola sy1]